MGVDNLQAVGVTVARGWQSLDSFPQDGSVVEVLDVHDKIYRAQWHSGRILTASLSAGTLKSWRVIE